MYGGETWAVLAETEQELERTEMKMVGFMCGIRLQDKCTNSDLRSRLGIDSIVEAIRIRILSIFKNKGNVQDCSNYRGIKLMSHSMKIWEGVVEATLRREVTIVSSSMVSCW